MNPAALPPASCAAMVQYGRSARAVQRVLLLLLLAGGAAACTSYIVGRDASAGGVAIIARNNDGDGATSPTCLVYHPARDSPALFKSNVNSFQLDLPAPGLAYWAMPDGPLADASSGRNTSGEAAGWNAAGVAISGTESIYNSDAALAAGAPAAVSVLLLVGWGEAAGGQAVSWRKAVVARRRTLTVRHLLLQAKLVNCAGTPPSHPSTRLPPTHPPTPPPPSTPQTRTMRQAG